MEALFKLIRVALGGEVPAGRLEGADWPALVALATEQGVAALAYDGLQKCYDADPSLSLPLDRELKAVKYEWFGSTLNVEMEYDKQWKAVSALGSLFADAGLRTVVLKGFALGACYPVPQHRYSCDFDCFLMGSGPATDRSAFELGNQAVEATGVKVDRSFYKNSAFSLKGMKVENHRFLTGWRGSARWKRFELELEQMLEVPGALRPLPETSLLVGPPLFNALFLTRHAQVHFLIEEGISLRHICDWAMFLRRYGPSLDWQAFLSCCARYGMDRFAGSMTRLAGYVCGVPVPSAAAFDHAAKSEHGAMANEPPVLRDAKSEHGNAANEPSVLRDAKSEHGGTLFPDDSTSDGLTSAGLTSADSTAADCSSVDRPSAGLTPADRSSASLTPADRRLLDDILALGKHSSQPKTRLGTALRILRSGWKFRTFSDETPLGCLLRYVWGYFVVRTPKL